MKNAFLFAAATLFLFVASRADAACDLPAYVQIPKHFEFELRFFESGRRYRVSVAMPNLREQNCSTSGNSSFPNYQFRPVDATARPSLQITNLSTWEVAETSFTWVAVDQNSRYRFQYSDPYYNDIELGFKVEYSYGRIVVEMLLGRDNIQSAVPIAGVEFW